MLVKIYHYVNEASESENTNSSEISEQNGTTCRYVQVKKRKTNQNKNPPTVLLPNCPLLFYPIVPLFIVWASNLYGRAGPLHVHFNKNCYCISTGIILENERRHWKCLFSRLICSLIHLSSSTSSVLTCPPPKDPLHASSPAQPAPRRRLLLPLFFQSSSSPLLSSSLRDPSSSLTLIVLSLFTKAFYIKVDAAFSCSCLFLKPQTIIHILCRLA